MPTASHFITVFRFAVTVLFNCMMTSVYPTIYPTGILFMATAH